MEANVGALIAAVAAIVAAVLSYRASTKANTVSDRKVDLEEYRDAQARYKEMLAESDRHQERLRGQIERLTTQVDGISQQLAKEQDVSNSLRDQIRALRGQVLLLEQMADTGKNRGLK